jgi:diguanylate cyclase (GGDEF)-like protein/PAS domain S-box-containing protein
MAGRVLRLFRYDSVLPYVSSPIRPFGEIPVPVKHSRPPARKADFLGKEYFENLFNQVPEAIIIGDTAGRVLRINAEFTRMFGYTRLEATGRSVDELIATGADLLEATAITDCVAHGQKVAREGVRRHKDGTPIHVSILGVPIMNRGQQLAVYGIYRDISDIKRAQEEILESQRQLREANVALQERTRQLEQVNVQLERTSNYDGLTAIPNRRYFEQFYDLEWRRAWRENRWISLIMIDVDFFKAYNDRNGHLAGDECLKHLAQALQMVNRASDLVCRYGGEEFVAVLSGTDLSGARLIAERMRQRVKALNLRHGDSSVGPLVTVSMGIAAQIPEATASPSDLLLKADQGLYLAKSMGRDQIQAVKA